MDKNNEVIFLNEVKSELSDANPDRRYALVLVEVSFPDYLEEVYDGALQGA